MSNAIIKNIILGVVPREREELILQLKLNKFILNEEENKTTEFIESKMSNKNVEIFYQLGNNFNLQTFQQQLRSKTHITYHLVANRDRFLELDIDSVVETLKGLQTIPQLRLEDAANEWVEYDPDKRWMFFSPVNLITD